MPIKDKPCPSSISQDYNQALKQPFTGLLLTTLMGETDLFFVLLS